MTSASAARIDHPRVRFIDRNPAVADISAEVIDGLNQRRKTLPPKLFYDARGSRLFDAITKTEEYYPTRKEIEILSDHGRAIAERVGERSILIEYGSGSSSKIRLLLERLRPAAYVPVDISREHLLESATALAEDYEWLEIYATCADYSADLPAIPASDDARYVGFFPGSSIGNFEPEHAEAFLCRVREQVGQGGCLLIGVDCKKDSAVLERAYNDAGGVTAAFNRNVLHHINDRLNADFDPELFEHRAIYNGDAGRIEMHLIAGEPVRCQVDGATFAFQDGEAVVTEHSYKYSPVEFAEMAKRAGFAVEDSWQDSESYFAEFLLTVE